MDTGSERDSKERLKRIVIVNQHGENRGDEAALRAMIRSLDKAHEGKVEFDVIVQFGDRTLTLSFDQCVNLHHMVMPVVHIVLLFLYSFIRGMGIEAQPLLTTKTQDIVAAIRDADLVISAPGGPYFGDIYASHEPVHWLYVWLGKLFNKPLLLYSPSTGPFNNSLMNVFRRKVFSMFDLLCVREEKSRDYLRELLGAETTVHLAADSALQEAILPMRRDEYFKDQREPLRDKLIVAVTGMQYRYPGDSDPPLQRALFTEIFLKCLLHLATRQDCHFIFMPQLYGRVHNDSAYHELLGQRLPPGTSWEVVSEKIDSDGHRRIFGMADICLASRYHPQIFSTSAGVPGLFICYEHKQYAYLKAIGMDSFTFDIRSMDVEEMCEKLDELIDRRLDLAASLRDKIPAMCQKAILSSRLAVSLMQNTNPISQEN